MRPTANHIFSKQIDYRTPSSGTRASVACPSRAETMNGLTAHSVEFVAKPQEAYRIQSILPSALTKLLNNVTGFAGCLVMASQQEARLLTVVTLWRGRDAENRYAENARLVERILAPYVDHRLRVQSLVAAVRTTLQDETETNADAAGFISEPHFPPGEEVCFA